jgi:hypothetical protein
MSQLDVDSKAAADAPQAASKQPEVLSRRSFLKSSGLAAIGITAVSGVGLATAAAPAAAAALNYSESFANLGSSNGQTLVRMARDIFPHDKLADEFYAAAVASYDQQAPKDAALKALVTDGIAHMDKVALNRYGKRYAAIAQEEERLEVLYAIENTAFFQKIKGGLVTGLYNNKAVWAELGYEGSSWEKGGYLNRGFNDIDWL